MEKIARICWNTNDWKYPSGIEGKSKNKHSYEKIMGYGHEEWLLDDTRIMPDGYHYGFLQAMNGRSDIHKHAKYDIHLFTITPTSQRVYIGCTMQKVLLLNKVRLYMTIIRRKGG